MVNKNRASTLQQRFGFADEALKTPAHDAIMVWLDREVERLAAEFLAPRCALNEVRIRQIEAHAISDHGLNHRRSEWPGMTGVPEAGRFIGIRSKVWEYPICKDQIKKDYIVGFADMLVLAEYTEPVWAQTGHTGPYRWDLWHKVARLLYEVKPVIESVGETIRQIRLYQTYDEGDYFIVSPDGRFRSVLEGQGIHFVQVPPDGAA